MHYASIGIEGNTFERGVVVLYWQLTIDLGDYGGGHGGYGICGKFVSGFVAVGCTMAFGHGNDDGLPPVLNVVAGGEADLFIHLNHFRCLANQFCSSRLQDTADGFGRTDFWQDIHFV